MMRLALFFALIVAAKANSDVGAFSNTGAGGVASGDNVFVAAADEFSGAAGAAGGDTAVTGATPGGAFGGAETKPTPTPSLAAVAGASPADFSGIIGSLF